MNRRDFIQKTSAAAALVASGLPLKGFAANPGKHLTILHTNDVHSYIDPFPPDHPKNPNRGGAARRATLIESIRRENPMCCCSTPATSSRARRTSTITAANWNSH